MPTEKVTDARGGWRRRWPEALVGLLAAVIFLGCLGSVDLWGKREQRAAAEAIDTVDHHHWLVAEVQGRPRLEKPPLPRWTIAALMLLTGRLDEWIVRWPAAACALGTVALVYALGRRMGGRGVGLASAMILSTSGLFVGEMRQAGPDGPLAFFTTLALYAAWRALDEGRPWRLLFHAALGLGFLCKGPIILMLTAVAILPPLVQAGRLRPGLRRLVDAPGLLIFAAIAASWPAAVAWHDANAPRLWLMEMSEKTGVLGTLSHRWHAPLVRYWPAMMFPWSIVAMAALVLPFLARASRAGAGGGRSSDEGGAGAPSPAWFAWWWAAGNMGILSLWAVAKPNYYLPCVPGLALLAGTAWVRWAGLARGTSAPGGGRAARAVLQAQWVVLFVGGILTAIAVQPWIPRSLGPLAFVPAAGLAVAVAASVVAWRRGADAMALAPIASAMALGVLVVYGVLAPAENPRRGHRELARTLARLVPPGIRSISFYNEVDEGLEFYLRGLDLRPVPGTLPRYSTAYDLAQAHHDHRDDTETVDLLDARREGLEKRALLEWLDRRDPADPFLLIRASLFDRYARELAGRATPVFRESGLGRPELVLLRAPGRPPIAAAGPPARR
jgi:4-amino-4-deoxy-L-arabinose transferase-like glycosyltransferase